MGAAGPARGGCTWLHVHTHTHTCTHAHTCTRVCTGTRPALTLAAPADARVAPCTRTAGARAPVQALKLVRTRARCWASTRTCTRTCTRSCASKRLVHAHTCARAPVRASGACTRAHAGVHTHTPVQASIRCTHTCTHVHTFLCMHLHTHAHSRACTAPLHTRSFTLMLHPAAAPRSAPAGRARPPVPPRRSKPLSFCLAAPFQGPRAEERRQGSHKRPLPPGRAGGGETETPAPGRWRGLGAPGDSGVP